MNICDICRLSQEVSTGQLLEAVFIDQAVTNPASREADRDFVLRATYPTVPLRVMVEHLADKLTGKQPKGAFIVQGDYGSGKSHALLALYHLASAGSEGQRWLERWGVQAAFPADTQVALVQLVSENPSTLWEPLFTRAERPDLSQQVRDYPTREQWAQLAATRPVLLIVDEVELWLGQLANGTPKERLRAALQNLLEATQLPVPLAAAISVYGRNPALMEVINRTQPPGRDIGAAEDRQKIVRHRLVEAVNEAQARKVVAAYIDAYQRAQTEFPSVLARLADLEKRMIDSYPFHPDFLDKAFQVYAAVPHHESTRGIIFLCATLLRGLASQRDLLLAGDLDLTDKDIASDLRRLDPDLIHNAQEDLQRCRGIDQAPGMVGSILLRSFSPYGPPGATREEVLADNFRPQVNINQLQSDLEATLERASFIDEADGRLVVTKEVVLVKQIEQQARALLDTPDGVQKAADRIKDTLRAFLSPEVLSLYPEEPLPEPLSGTGLRCVLSLEPLTEEQAKDILVGRGNTGILIGPRPSLRGRLTHDRESLLRAARVLVCEALLAKPSKRQSDLRQYKQRFDRELKGLGDHYGRWARLSRTNELGEDPAYVLRSIDLGLSVDAIKGAILKENDVEVLKAGLQKILRYYERGAARGSEQAGRTIRELREELRRHAGLPIILEERQVSEALQGMLPDSHPQTGVVVAMGKALYGYDERPLPVPVSGDWRVWLKAYAPEPPAPEDVKQAVRQALAEAANLGVLARKVRDEMSSRLNVPSQEVLRALAELVNGAEAVLEQKESRFPNDGFLASEAIAEQGQVWLASLAPPDDRQARRRIMGLVQGSPTGSLTWGELKQHAALESIEEATLFRGLSRLFQQRQVTSPGADLIRERSLLKDQQVIMLPPGEGLLPLPWEPFSVSVGPYRLLEQFERDLRDRLPEDGRVQQATFEVSPMAGSPDPLFGYDSELAATAQLTAGHRLTCAFTTPISKAALLNISHKLVERLAQAGQLVLSAEVRGEAPRYER